MGMCPTLRQLMELELKLFSWTQLDTTLPEAKFNELETEWDRVFKKTKALGGVDLVLLEEPEASG